MSKESTAWHSSRLDRSVNVARWGEVGTPVLIFPTAAGDAEEIERFHLVSVLSEFLTDKRIKIYSVDSVPGQVWMKEDNSFRAGSIAQNRFDEFLVEEVVPAIRTDCGGEEEEIVVAGASIGAFNALSSITRHPDLFKAAICMSGTYDLGKFLKGDPTQDTFQASPLHFVPELAEDSAQLAKLRERYVLITHGKGKWEEPAQSWRVADMLGKRGVPNRVEEWDEEWDHDWPTWRNMMPKYLGEFL